MRFNHGLLLLMAAALVAAFVLPADALHGKIDNLFWPISAPVRQLAHGVDSRLTVPQKRPSEKNDSRTEGQLRDEIETLKFQLAQKDQQIDDLHRQLNEFNSVNKTLFDRCRIVSVMGGDAGNHQTLTLSTSFVDTFATGMPVIYPHGLAGRLEVIGVGAARVRLVTDKDFQPFRGEFVRYKQDTGEFIHLPLPFKSVAGRGDGRMVIQQYKTIELDSTSKKFKLAVGDWVVLNDKDWPQPIQGIKLGEVESIVEQRNPLFSTITVRPDADLMKLAEVMVMVKK